MTLSNEQVKVLSQGFLQLGISVIFYVIFSVLGLIISILVGNILPDNFITIITQSIILILTQCIGLYFAVLTVKSDTTEVE